jgi:hypothetical protein
MLVQYEKYCIMGRKVYQWVEKFQNGRINVYDEVPSGYQPGQMVER